MQRSNIQYNVYSGKATLCGMTPVLTSSKRHDCLVGAEDASHTALLRWALVCHLHSSGASAVQDSHAVLKECCMWCLHARFDSKQYVQACHTIVQVAGASMQLPVTKQRTTHKCAAKRTVFVNCTDYSVHCIQVIGLQNHLGSVKPFDCRCCIF